jgi:hypothetical protein
MFIGLHVNCPLFLSDFNEREIFSTDFEKYSNIEFHEKPVKWEPICSIRTEGNMEKQTRRR